MIKKAICESYSQIAFFVRWVMSDDGANVTFYLLFKNEKQYKFIE